MGFHIRIFHDFNDLDLSYWIIKRKFHLKFRYNYSSYWYNPKTIKHNPTKDNLRNWLVLKRIIN